MGNINDTRSNASEPTAMARTKFFQEDQPAPATRTRLRGGTLRDLDKAPICECTLYDLEDGNVGIVLPNAETRVPDRVYIEDGKDLTVAAAQIRWRMGPYLFSAYLEQPVPVSGTASA